MTSFSAVRDLLGLPGFVHSVSVLGAGSATTVFAQLTLLAPPTTASSNTSAPRHVAIQRLYSGMSLISFDWLLSSSSAAASQASAGGVATVSFASPGGFYVLQLKPVSLALPSASPAGAGGAAWPAGNASTPPPAPALVGGLNMSVVQGDDRGVDDALVVHALLPANATAAASSAADATSRLAHAHLPARAYGGGSYYVALPVAPAAAAAPDGATSWPARLRAGAAASVGDACAHALALRDALRAADFCGEVQAALAASLANRSAGQPAGWAAQLRADADAAAADCAGALAGLGAACDGLVAAGAPPGADAASPLAAALAAAALWDSFADGAAPLSAAFNVSTSVRLAGSVNSTRSALTAVPAAADAAWLLEERSTAFAGGTRPLFFPGPRVSVPARTFCNEVRAVSLIEM